MFSSVKALSYIGLNIDQKKSFDILTRDSPSAISLLAPKSMLSRVAKIV
jgi:hypothetical protein